MACCQSRSRSSYEFSHPQKPENNVGCSCGGRNIGCDTPSSARAGSPRWNWEQTYGKLVTTFTEMYDNHGHVYYVIERTPCPTTSQTGRRTECCSLKYRFVR